jgi:hypothetical protein
MAEQSGYTLGPVMDHPVPYAGPFGYAYVKPGAAQFLHPSQQHYATPIGCILESCHALSHAQDRIFFDR